MSDRFVRLPGLQCTTFIRPGEVAAFKWYNLPSGGDRVEAYLRGSPCSLTLRMSAEEFASAMGFEIDKEAGNDDSTE